jgi:hypothetical protein
MRIVYRLGIYIFLAGLFLQLLFAGFGVFLGSWDTHVSLGRPFGLVTVVLLIFALLGRLPARQVWLTALLIPLYVLQILLVYLPGRHGVIILSTLHPVNAGVLLAIGMYLAYWSGKATHTKAQMEEVSREQIKETGDAVISVTRPRGTTSMHNQR